MNYEMSLESTEVLISTGVVASDVSFCLSTCYYCSATFYGVRLCPGMAMPSTVFS